MTVVMFFLFQFQWYGLDLEMRGSDWEVVVPSGWPLVGGSPLEGVWIEHTRPITTKVGVYLPLLMLGRNGYC